MLRLLFIFLVLCLLGFSDELVAGVFLDTVIGLSSIAKQKEIELPVSRIGPSALQIGSFPLWPSSSQLQIRFPPPPLPTVPKQLVLFLKQANQHILKLDYVSTPRVHRRPPQGFIEPTLYTQALLFYLS
ncbi:unnamed protein product [Urochloa humidicola]